FEMSSWTYPVPLTLPVGDLELNLCDSQDYDVFNFQITTESGITVWIDHDEIDTSEEFRIQLSPINPPSSHVGDTSNGYTNTFVTASGLTPGQLTVVVSFNGNPRSQISYNMKIVPCAVDEAEIAGCLDRIDWTTCSCLPPTTG